MGHTDLDTSLDDIIKKNKRRESDTGRGRGSSRGGSRGSRGGSKGMTQRLSTRNAPPSSRREGGGGSRNDSRIDSRTNKTISKSRVSLRGRIGRYNGNSSVGRMDDRRENTYNKNNNNHISHRPERMNTKERIDPASIIITKSISRPSSSSSSSLKQPSSSSADLPAMTIQGKGGYSAQKQATTYPGGYNNQHRHQQQHQQQDDYGYRVDDQQIVRPTASGQIDTYNGSTIVLICNLDPSATAEDVGDTCSQFGPIVSCDILLDQHGRPLSKAEIEFVYHASAQECVSKLDNQIADGRVLRAFLKSKATPPAAPRFSSRTVMSNPQGTDYTPQLSVRYDQQRLPQGNMHHVHSRHYSHYPSQY